MKRVITEKLINQFREYLEYEEKSAATIEKYIREQEKQDQIEDSLSKKEYEDPFKGSK